MWPPAELLQSVTNSSSTTSLAGKPPWVTAAEVVIFVVGAAVAGTLFVKLATAVARRAGAPKGVIHETRQWLSVLVTVGIVAGVAYLTGLSSDLTTLTLSGIAGLAVSLALQNTLSNIIAGVLLLNDGILRLGDDIQYGGPGGVRGEVVKLSLRTTWLKTSEGVVTVIGNSNLSAGPILNHSAGARLGKKLRV